MFGKPKDRQTRERENRISNDAHWETKLLERKMRKEHEEELSSMKNKIAQLESRIKELEE